MANPVLYEGYPPDERSEEEYHSSWGIGVLTDVKSAIVREVRNGAYELTIRYKADGVLAEELKIGRWVKVPVPSGTPVEPTDMFRIYDISRSVANEILVRCEHMSYRINGVYVHRWLNATAWDGSAVSPKKFSPYSLMREVFANSFKPMKGSDNPIYQYISFASDYPEKEVPINWDVKQRGFMDFLINSPQSIIGQFGGEVVRKGSSIRFVKNRSNQQGGQWYRLEYGSNIKSLDVTYTFADVATHIVPHISLSLPFNINETKFDSSSGTTKPLTEKEWSYTSFDYFDTENSITLYDEFGMPVSEKYGFIKVSPVDFRYHEEYLTKLWIGSGAGESIESRGYRLKNALRQLAADWISYHKPQEVSIKCTVDFIALWQTEEFKDLRGIEKLNLSDNVQVYHPDIHFPIMAKVVAQEYDCLLEKIIKLDISSDYYGIEDRPEQPDL
ncbi:hypothetical protein ABR763_01055 [Bacillus cereus]